VLRSTCLQGCTSNRHAFRPVPIRGVIRQAARHGTRPLIVDARFEPSPRHPLPLPSRSTVVFIGVVVAVFHRTAYGGGLRPPVFKLATSFCVRLPTVSSRCAKRASGGAVRTPCWIRLRPLSRRVGKTLAAGVPTASDVRDDRSGRTVLRGQRTQLWTRCPQTDFDDSNSDLSAAVSRPSAAGASSQPSLPPRPPPQIRHRHALRSTPVWRALARITLHAAPNTNRTSLVRWHRNHPHDR
jgi:hypothetical protein